MRSMLEGFREENGGNWGSREAAAEAVTAGTRPGWIGDAKSGVRARYVVFVPSGFFLAFLVTTG